MKTKLIILSSIMTASFSTAAFAVAEKITCASESTKVEFEAIGKPSLLRIIGKGSGVKCDMAVDATAVSGTLSFPIDSLDTGIELRNRHMKEKYLHTKEFPIATLTLYPIKMKQGFPGAVTSLKDEAFTGKLRLNGVEREITGKFTANSFDLKSEINEANAELEIKLTDFNVGIPSFAGITVADTVKIKVALDGVARVK